MATLNFRTLGEKSFPEFENEYYRSAYVFDSLLKNLAWLPYRCDEPLKYSKFLQNLVQPLWIVDYERADGQAEKFRQAFHSCLKNLNADIAYAPKTRAALLAKNSGRVSIRLSHHSVGRKPGVWHYKIGYLPDFFHFDRDGYSGWSELRTEKDIDSQLDTVSDSDASDFYNDRICKLINLGASKYKQSKDNEINQDGFFFIALQTTNDAVMRLSHFKDYLGIINDIVLFLQSAGHTIVIKRHPKCDDPKVGEFLANLSATGVFITEASIHKLIPKSKAVITVNSGVGFEALMHLKPVICLGAADYSSVGWEVKNIDEFKGAIELVLSGGAEAHRIKKFLYLVCNKYQVDLSSELSMQRCVFRALAFAYLQRQEI